MVELEATFAHNEFRRALFESLKKVLIEYVPVGSELDLFIGGSFVTVKESPNDIDMAITFSADRPMLKERQCVAQIMTDRHRIKSTYRIDMLVGDVWRKSLQMFRPQELNRQAMPTYLKGILKVST